MAKLIEHIPLWGLGGGIFTRLGAIYPTELPWIDRDSIILDMEYFGNRSGEKESSPLIDKAVSLLNEGDIVLTDEHVDILARIIYKKYAVQWQKLYRLLSEQYNPIENYSMVETETPNITRTETPDITRTETPNVTRDKTTTSQSDFSVTTDSNIGTDIYGFNSTAPVPQGESNANSTVTTQGDAEDNVTTETESETGTRTETETGTRTETETGTRTLTRSGNIGVTTSQQMIESEIKLWEWTFYNTVFDNVDTVLTVPKYNI